jgi:hypothetical protein
MLKKLYHLIAGLALLNLLAVGALGGYLAGSGKLNLERLHAVVETLRAPAPDPHAEAPADAADPPADAVAPEGQPTPAEREIARLNLERVTRAAQDQLNYASTIMVDIERRREDLEREKQALADARAAEEVASADENLQKELEVIGLLKPKVALDNLLARDPAAAARILLALDGRTAKKIVEAASKDPVKWEQILRIQEHMRAPVAQENTTGTTGPVAAPDQQNPA